MTNKYVGAAKFIKNLITGGKQKTTGTEVIKSVKPSVPKNKSEKLKSQLKIATQKSKASQAKLDNTIFRIEQQKKRLEREKKMGGGFMGKRMGYKGGSKPDFLDLDKDGDKEESMKKAAKDAKNESDEEKLEEKTVLKVDAPAPAEPEMEEPIEDEVPMEDDASRFVLLCGGLIVPAPSLFSSSFFSFFGDTQDRETDVRS